MKQEFNEPGDAILRDKIRQDLPECPHEIIEDWLMPYAVDIKWPPAHPKWSPILTHRPLDFWQRVRWTREPVNVLALLTPNTLGHIKGLIDAHVHGEPNQYARLRTSRERFYDAESYIRENGRLPGPPPPLLHDGFHFEAIDGNHRLAAYFYLGCRFEPECWVGRDSRR